MFNWFKKTAEVVQGTPEKIVPIIQGGDLITPLALSESVAFKDQGNVYLNNGKLEAAAACFRQAIERNPRYAEAYTNLGLVFQMQGNLDEAIALYRKAVVFKPELLTAHVNLGIALMNLGQEDAAEESFRRVIALDSKHAATLQSLGAIALQRGAIAAQRGDFPHAETLLRRALELQPDYAEAHYNLGTLFMETKHLPESEASFRRALELRPDYADAHINLGILFEKAGHQPEAEASYRHALELKPDYAEAHFNLGNLLEETRRLPEAEASYLRALELNPDYADVHINLGNLLKEAGRQPEAETSFRRALELQPNYADAHYNLGNLLLEAKRLLEAEASFRRALELKPEYAEAHSNLGNLFLEANRLPEAEASYRRALELNPDDAFTLGNYLHSKMHCCNWEGFDDTFQKLLAGINAVKAVSTPFCLLATPSTLAQQKHCAEIFVQKLFAEIPASSSVNDRYAHRKIRLGYFSSDFYNHATAYLMAELFDQHDRARFEVTGFSFGASPDDNMRQRVSSSFDRFIDVNNQTDQDIATLVRSLEIDIAIDLKGFTRGARTGIFALHPAPIQVSYLGYPGTMSAPYIEYLIADPTLIPVEHQQHYSEKIAYLPDSYQVNDSHRCISERQFTRHEVGLPEEGFVFCCFNGNFKITPTIFDIWMQLLKQIEGSVLWLFESNAHASQNLRNEAIKRGIAPERIVFAQRMDLPDHLARHRLANLFLDTFFCNAHTTASDALWAGLPVLTYLGDTFAGRVAASLLNAIGLPELITRSHEEYKALALELATNPEKLSSIRQRLAKNRSTHPLFNTALFARHIEDAYTQMWKRHLEYLLPDHIYVRGI